MILLMDVLVGYLCVCVCVVLVFFFVYTFELKYITKLSFCFFSRISRIPNILTFSPNNDDFNSSSLISSMALLLLSHHNIFL